MRSSMTDVFRTVHFLNQLFGGIGGEEHANAPVEVRDGTLGPGRVLQQGLGEGVAIAAKQSSWGSQQSPRCTPTTRRSKCSAGSWALTNDAIADDLYRGHADDHDFAGVIAVRTRWTSQEEKDLTAFQAAKFARLPNANGGSSPTMPAATTSWK
jgi:Glycine/sarcosine/betaine reductase selenoprotein B (GRDB)